MPRSRGIKAWLVTWEHFGAHAKPPRRIAMVINSRRSPERVREIVELLYINETASPGELVLYAAGKHNPFPARFGEVEGITYEGEITCGHNPYLRARRVEELYYVGDGGEEEQVKWVDNTAANMTQIRKAIREQRNRP
jgi:hypothetical protein